MTFLGILSFISPLVLIYLGWTIRNSQDERWAASKGWWPFFLYGGIVILILKVINLII